MSDLIDFFKLNATFDPVTSSTCEIIQTSDRTQRKRQITLVKNWKRTKRLGHGAFGTVWLEREGNDPEAKQRQETRAVKELAKGRSTNASRIDYTRELLALGRLSKVSIQY
jgi:hypothetical protein